MSFFITTEKIKKTNNEYPKQDISKERIKYIQKGLGEKDTIIIVLSKKILNLESDMYLQGPKEAGLKGAKEIVSEMKKKGKDPCKKALKHIKKFLDKVKNKNKPEEEDVQRAVFDAFVLYVCKSKYVKLKEK